MSSLCCVLFLLTLAVYSNCEKNASASVQREGRQLDLPRDLRLVRFYVDGHKHLRRPPPPQISPRSDHFPQRIGPGPGPGPFGRPQFGRPPIPHLRRRVHSGPGGPPPPGVFLRSNGPPPPFANYQALKSGRFPQSKGPYVQKPGPGNYYRQGQGPIAPNLNAIPQGPNFKPSPIYNGEVIVRRPSAAPLVAASPPESASHSHAPKSEEKHDALRFYKSNAAVDSHMYSVYEDTDSDAEETFPPLHNIGESAMKEAKQFLNFMSTNEYFLPKMQPDYRKLDQQQQQQLQESEAAAALNAYQQQQQQQQQRNAESIRDNAAFTVNAPLQVSASSSQAQAQAQVSNAISPTSTYPNRHPAQSNFGSYQADNNLFVVSSDGMKNVHHVVSTSSYPESNQQQQQQQQQHQQSLSMPTFSSELRPMMKERVPDPERVEFTERDAIHVSYTSNPMDSMARYNEQQHQQQQHQQQQEHQQSYSSPTGMQEDEDEEMMQSASDVYGRIKVNSSKNPANPSVQQRDTEEYCERICSNVQDDDEEVVCGSDGYMYTSEAQMECYASCLHIDVTIQSKGTCNQSL